MAQGQVNARSLPRRVYADVAALAAATLLLEGALLRLLAVAQFYHFAFLVVSLALLGFGASGTLLSLSPRLRAMPLPRLLPLAGAAFVCSAGVSYAVVNWLPFDSYSIAWQRRQIVYFLLYYLALTGPFLCGGLGIGACWRAAANAATPSMRPTWPGRRWARCWRWACCGWRACPAR